MRFSASGVHICAIFLIHVHFSPLCQPISTQGLPRNHKPVRQRKRFRRGWRIVRFSASGIQICAIFGIPYISHPNITAARLTDGSCQKSQNSERAKHIRSGHIIVSFGASGIHICNIFEIPCISHLRQRAC